MSSSQHEQHDTAGHQVDIDHAAHAADHGAGHGAGHEGHSGQDSSWRTAVSATLHCLTGCAIGEVLGLVLATWWGWSDIPSIALAVVLAFFFGYLLTFSSVRRHGMGFRDAIRVALAADTISILTMEIIDNGIMVLVPGAMEAGLLDWLFWGALAVALALAFVLTVPINRELIRRGKGHAVVHGMH